MPNVPYQTTLVTPNGGVNPLAGTGMDYNFTLGGVGIESKVTIILTDTLTNFQVQVGAGNVTGITPTYCFVFNNKTYVLASNTVYISAIGDSATWNDPNAIGNGYLSLGNYFGTPEPLVAASPYQGKLVFFARFSSQIWTIDANLQNWSLLQFLNNIGTVAPLSVQPLGDLDIFFLSDTGIRSFRVRDLTLNAFVSDIGSPIDTLIQTALLADNYTSACGIVTPEANRYWLYLNGVIYVFSYFPSAKITAWGTYLPTYPNNLAASTVVYPASPAQVTYAVTIGRSYWWNKGANEVSISDGIETYTNSTSFIAQGATLTQIGVANANVTSIVEEQSPFTPSKFVVYNGQVYARDASAFYIYGGMDNNTYDGCIATTALPWLDLKIPATLKEVRALDAAFKGSFKLQVGTNQLAQELEYTWQGNQPTFQIGTIPLSLQGYHIKVQAQTTDNQPAVLSSLIIHYQKGAEK